MVLSSQQTRPGTGRSNMYASKKTPGLNWAALILGGVAVAGLAWVFWPEATEADTGDGAALAADGTNAATDNVSVLESNDDALANASIDAGADRRQDDGGARSASDVTYGVEQPFLPRGEEASSNAANLEARDAGTNEATPNDPPPITMGSQAGESGTATPGDLDDEAAKVERSTIEEADRNSPAADSGGVDLQAPTPSRPAAPSAAVDPEVNRLMATAAGLAEQKKPAEARAAYNAALHHPRVGASADEIRDRMAELNAVLVFSATRVPNDPLSGAHVIQSGDRLVNIAKAHGIDYRFLARINGMADPGKIRVGQTLKTVQGPFHVVVDKSDFRMDVYVDQPGASSAAPRMYVRSFPVGLGEHNSTPLGAFRVRPDSKLVNPQWTNPRTGEHFGKDDPKNPIGERWIGLEGTDEKTKLLAGYGIHGTIEPQSVGRQASMGCVRMLDADVELIYEMLVEGLSTVTIRE